MSEINNRKCLLEDDVISIYDAYGGSMALMKSYEPILNAPFLHALMSQLQLLDDRCAAQRTASLDWNSVAQPWLMDVSDRWIPTTEIKPAMISALGGFITTRDYVKNIAVETSSDELFRFVEALNSALLEENKVSYNDPAWVRWCQCVAAAKDDPEMTKLHITRPNK